MNPITSATVSGVGQTPLGVVEGTWVVGFFQDGAEAQQPIIIGTLPGSPDSLPVVGGAGFSDNVNAAYPKYKETDVNRLAVNDTNNPHGSLTLRSSVADRDMFVGRADFNAVDLQVANAEPEQLAADDGVNFSEPKTSYAAQYPHNHVYETEGGHIREYDDTVGAKRIHERHASGTGYEIDNEGTKITRVKKDNYNITTADDYCHIQGISRHTIDKGVRVRVNGEGKAGNSYSIEVGEGSNVNVEVNGGNINLTTLSTGDEEAGDININASRNLNVQVNGDMNVAVLGKSVENVSGTKDEFVVDVNTKTGKTIQLNP
jgi:hypothetical protein